MKCLTLRGLVWLLLILLLKVILHHQGFQNIYSQYYNYYKLHAELVLNVSTLHCIPLTNIMS